VERQGTMYRGKKTVRRGGGNSQLRGQNTTKTRPMTRQQNTLLCENDQTKENDEKFALVEFLLNKKLLVVNHNDLINLNKQGKIKLGSNVLVKMNDEKSTSAILFCVGSQQECLNELNIIKCQRDSKMNSDYDDSLDDTPLLTTTRVPEPTQKEIDQNKKSNIPEETDSCISFDINYDEPNTHSSLHTLSLKIKPSLTHLMPMNHRQDVTVTASSLTSSIDITAAASEPTPSAINTNSVTTTSSKKQNRMDTLSDLTVQLNEVTEDRDKWRDKYLALEKRYSELSDVSMLIPTNDSVCEWISTMYDAIQRPVNSDVNYDDEATKLGIPSNLLKYCVNLSKPPTVTARKLFQQICLDELTKGLPWSKIPDNKIEALHAFGEKLFGHLKWDRKTIKTSLQNLIRGERANLKRDQKNGCPNEQTLDHNGLIVAESVPEHTESQHNSVDDVDNLNQSEFEDRDHMNEEDLYKTNDTDQCSLLFNHDNTFYDTLINETCYDLEKNTLDSDEETELVTDTLGSTDDEESFDENETDVVVEEDGNDNEQKNEMFNDQFQRDYDETDISVCLLTLKTKHNLTFECLNDIRKLLIVLKVQNVPSSIYHIRKLINTKSRSTPCTLSSTETSSMIICQKCERVSFSTTSCSHIDCENHEKYTTNPYNYIYFDIRDQLQQIFRREQHINCFTPENKPFINTSMHDIYDGKIYRSLFSQVETNKTNYIMTLMMNVDGVAVGNNTEQSLWIITCVINEIKRKQRFKIQNVVVGGICSCYKKPSRAIMQILLEPIVNQLLLLEEQHLFQIKGTKNEYKLIRMYLIGACNDKPANSLVQNAPEPIAKYGCSRCELRGETVLSNSNDQIAQNKSSSTEKKSRKDTHKIRVFPTNEDNQTQLRSTARCQLILNKFSKLTHNKQCLNNEKESNLRLGYFGKCSRIASTVNGTKNLPREIENNLQLIKNSSLLLDMYCISSPLYLFISDLQDCKSNPPIVSNNYQVQKPTSTIHDNDKQELLLKFGKELLLYNKCFIKGVTFATLHYSKSKQFQDCAILYRHENEHYFGIINKIILIQTSNNLLFQVLPLCNNKKDQVLLSFNTQKILCDNVEYGTINFDHHIHINANDVIEKVSYYQFKKQFIFIRYPTLTESS
ncbi:unnamed protein product, partial [Rotaria sp. Silwood1]